MVGGSAFEVQAGGRVVVFDSELDRSLSVARASESSEAAVSGRDCDVDRVQVRGDLPADREGLRVHHGQRVHQGGDPGDGEADAVGAGLRLADDEQLPVSGAVREGGEGGLLAVQPQQILAGVGTRELPHAEVLAVECGGECAVPGTEDDQASAATVDGAACEAHAVQGVRRQTVRQGAVHAAAGVAGKQSFARRQEEVRTRQVRRSLQNQTGAIQRTHKEF